MSRAKTKSVAALLAFAAAFLLAALFCFGFPARRAHAEDATASDALGLMNAVQNVAESESVIVAVGELSVKDTEFVLANATSPSVGSEGGESGSIEMDLQSQINLAGNGATVSLDKDYTESVVIPEGKTITLDLNGHTLTSDTDNVATVYNDGNLTIVDNGTTKGKITRAATEADGSENTYYVIANHGVMTLDGIHVSNENVEDTSSLIINNIKANGVYEQENPAKLTIESGTYFCAGGNVVKNDEYGILVIEDGEFTCSEPSGKGAIYAVIQNWANATITGGIFTHTDTAEGIAYSACAYGGQTSSNNISGGTFSGATAIYLKPGDDTAGIVQMTVSGTAKIQGVIAEDVTFPMEADDSCAISGGSFTVEPDEKYLADNFEFIDNDGNGVYEVMEGVVAKIGDVGYTSLQAAINAAETGETVTLLSDVKGNITVAQDKQITLDLNGKKIENDGSSHTVTNYGTLTVTGNGTVDNTANGMAALYNAPDASLTILSGTFVRSQEAGSLDGKSDGGNSYYVILNQGEMVIGTADDEAANEEILVYAGTSPEDSANHRHSSLISSGYFDTATYQEENAYPTLTIYGGTFYGGNGTVKNDELNTLTIAGGTFHAPDQALMNWSKATITGGEFNGSVIAWYYNGVNLGKYDVSTDIQGGVFNNVVEDRNFSNGNAPRLEGISITNGTFASPVREEYLAEGYSFTLEDGNYVPANTAAVAEIDREGVVYPFAELAAALEAAQSGDTIRLLADYTGSISLAKEGVTLDLNGNDIITTGSVSLSITAGNVTVTNSAEEESVIRNSAYIAVYVDNTDAPVTITNIRIDLSSSADSINTVIGIYADNAEIAVDSVNIQVQASGDVTIEPTNQNMWAAAIVVSNSEAVIENSYLATEISGNRREGHTFHSIGNSDTVLNNVEIVSNDSGAMIVGTYGNTDEQKEAAVQADQNTFPKLTITNSKITATGFAVLGNGAAHGTVIDISDSMITSETAQAIYHPQYGYMYISGDTEITGYTGIEMRAGNLVFNGGTVTATGDFSEEPYGNGSTVGGAALAISQHTTNMPISVTVNGGTFNATGNGGYAVYEVDLQNEEATDVIEIALNGGTYNAAVDSENVEQYIHGGQYIELPAEEAFADNYEGVEYNGYYVVIESTTDDTAALLAARANAQADVKAYAASLGVKWQEIVNAAADAESDNYKEAVLVVNMYDAIGSALSESAVAVARLNAMDAIEGYVSSAETALQTAKTNAVAEIASWLEGYLDEIIGGSASQNIVASMAVTLETEDGDLYAKIVSAFGEKNAPLVLKYYNEALTAIDNAESVSDVTMAVSTFKAQVASVEAAAGNTPALTGVYVLLAVVLVVLIAAAAAIIVLTLKKKPAAEAAAPVQEDPAQEAPAESAQEETPAAETAEEEAAQEETPAAEAQPAEALEEASDELAAADDDKDRIVIEANVRTFNEAYEELDEDKKALFNDVKEYALTKPQTRQVDLSSGICVKYGSKQVVKLVVRRGYPVALFLLENEMLKDFRRTTNSSAKLKIHATELVLREEADLAAAHRMVDLSLEQIAIDIENAKERRREARRARRKQKQAEAQADGESSDS